jgi:hypothetical protein
MIGSGNLPGKPLNETDAKMTNSIAFYIPVSTLDSDRVFPLQARKSSRKFNLIGEAACRTKKKLGLSAFRVSSLSIET